MLDLFDTPTMEVNCPVRNESIVPLQALALMNGPFAERCGRALGERIIREVADDEAQQANLAYRLLFARLPTESERKAIIDFLALCVADRRRAEAAAGGEPMDEKRAKAMAWSQAALVLLNTSEFLFID
jgi:hypothetical protein